MPRRRGTVVHETIFEDGSRALTVNGEVVAVLPERDGRGHPTVRRRYYAIKVQLSKLGPYQGWHRPKGYQGRRLGL